jgi:hypothetical protein
MCLNSFSSSGQRNPVEFTFNSAIRSKVIFAVGVNLGGCLGSCGSVSNGSSGICRVTQQSKGNCVEMGWIFSPTCL